jgi:phosphatidylglycerol:prolipoprotein diacylglycerol transferase
MGGHFIHDFDPEIGRILGVPLYWYGAVYCLGFSGVLAWLGLRRARLGLSRREVVELTIFIAAGVLVGGRAFDIAVYEFGYYRQHPLDALNWWKGGLASHGVLLGGAAATALFSLWRTKPFLLLADEVVVAAAFLLAVGRLGNFIEGGVVGSRTEMPWGVVYRDLEGPRHPVALYDGAKNLLMVPIMFALLHRYPAGRGIAMSAFVLLYGLLRFFVDELRDYESYWLGLGKGQFFNLAMAVLGLGLGAWFFLTRRPVAAGPPVPAREERIGWVRIVILIALFLYPLGIPTSWTGANIEMIRQGGVEPPPSD